MNKIVKMTPRINSLLLAIMIVASASYPMFSQQNTAITEDNAPQFLYGIAAVYNNDLEGEVTASGEAFSQTALSVAHRSLPFGTRVEIENLSNGKKVEALINDRGPFYQNRIINATKQVADILSFLEEGSSFVKISILELGSSLPTPIGLPTPPVGQDIPQSFDPNMVTNTNSVVVPTNAGTPVAQPLALANKDNNIDEMTPNDELDQYNTTAVSDDLFNDDELFADIDDEFDFMDDTFEEEPLAFEEETPVFGEEALAFEESTALAQTIDNNNTTPRGFSNGDDFFIEDPLTDIEISVDDEYVVAPTSVLDPSSYDLTQEEQELMKQEATEQDPFSDLFDDRGGAYSFQEEVASSLAYGPTGGTPVAAPVMPAPVAEPVPTPTPIEEPTPPANNINGDIIPPTLAPTDEYNDDFYNDSYNTPDPVKSPMPEVEEGFAPQKIGDHYIIQIGAFSNQKNAMALYEQLRDGGFNAYITDVKIKGKNLMRVRIGYFKTIEEAIQMSQKLEIANKLENRIIKVEYEENK